MAGLGLFKQKSVRALEPSGLLQSAYVFLCIIYKKSARASRQGSFDLRPELHAKNVFWAPREAFVVQPSIQKPSQKHQNLTFIG